MGRLLAGSVFAGVLLAGGLLLAGPDSCPGLWRASTPPGSGGIADVLTLPSGALVAGTRTGGLAFYERGPTGIYQWRTVTAGRGSVASNQITSLALFLGDLWVGTSNAGISVFDFDTGTWSVINTANSVLPTNKINHLTAVGPDPAIANPQDTHHSLWASTDLGAVLYRFQVVGQFSGWTWTLYDTRNGLPASHVRDVGVQFSGGNRYTWFATLPALVRWDGTTFVDFSDNCNLVTADRILVADANTVWFSGLSAVPDVSGHVPSGLCRYKRPERGAPFWTHYPNRYGYDLSLDVAGRLWAGGVDLDSFDEVDAGGGFVHDQGTWCLFRSQNAGTLGGDQVAAVHGTGELAWFGQRDTNHLDSYTTNWRTIRKEILGLEGDVGPVVFGHDMTFAGGSRGIAYKSDANRDWTFRSYTQDPDDVANALLIEGTRLWIGSDTSGLHGAGFDRQTFTVAAPDESHSTANGLASNNVQALALDLAGRLWVGTTMGLSLRGNGYWLNFTTANSPLVGDNVLALAVDAAGKLWIGTRTGGISILDPDAAGGPAWSSQTTAQGLASNDVRALARATDDAMWAATLEGACEWSPETAGWTVHDAVSGALPIDTTQSLVVDGKGRVWVGTTHGLAAREGGAWRHYHPTSSTLARDNVYRLAASADELWVSTLNEVAIREEITGPIGELPPSIASFAPAAAKPGLGVVVNGENFDARGPQYNQVFVGIEDVGGFASKPAEVLSVTPTQIIFRVPEMAEDGKIRVVANCLEAQSAATLRIAPRINSMTPQECLSPGSILTIQGAGFAAGGGAQVRLGNGPWRSPALLAGGAIGASFIRYPLQLDDQEGFVQVRRQDGLATTTSQDAVTIRVPQLEGYLALQGVERMPMIWGKRTLVVLDFAEGVCTSATAGTSYWKKLDGTLRKAGKAYGLDPYGLEAIEPAPGEPLEFQGRLEFICEFASSRSGWGAFFPLEELASIVCVVENNGVELVSVEIPAAELAFKEIEVPLRIKAMSLFCTELSSPPGSMEHFWSIATPNLQSLARIFPQQDHQPFSGSAAWIQTLPTNVLVGPDATCVLPCLPWSESLINGAQRQVLILEYVQTLLDPGPTEIALGLVEECITFNFTYSENSDSAHPGLPAFLVARPLGTGSFLARILGKHVLGCAESKYDEKTSWGDYADYLAYYAAALTQLGFDLSAAEASPRSPRIYSLGEGAWRNLDEFSVYGGKEAAKSVMANVAGKDNGNSFYEPVCQAEILERLDFLATLGGGGGAMERTLRLGLMLSANGAAVPRISYLDESGQPASPPQPDGRYLAIARGPGGAALAELPFAVRFDPNEDPDQPLYVDLRIPFPDAARSVEILHEGSVLLELTQSPGAPSVSVTSPGGGRFSASDSIHVSWTASDPDGGTLQYALDYSADNGVTWIKLPQYWTASSFEWTPGFVPRSATGRIRVRASDGFNTATALSAPFSLTSAPPLVFLRSPADGQQVTEGTVVPLGAGSMTSEGIDQGAFVWAVDGQALPIDREGNGATHEHRLERAGLHTVRVTLTDPSGVQVFKEASIEVLPDYDRDGLPNAYEQANDLNPLDRTDASQDPDGDGLTSFVEHRRGTNPRVADTDGDGADDGAEAAAQTDPLSADSKPPAQPTLAVTPDEVALSLREDEATSAPQTVWVINDGPGTLTWSLQSAPPWLEVTPMAGTAPTKLTLTATADGLAPGEHSGEMVIAAPGALESPGSVLVRLTLTPGDDEPPPGTRFQRGDANGDGGLNISDASATLLYLFVSADRAPPCLKAADANDDAVLNITDAIFSLAFLFLGGQRPPPPFPGCGLDLTPDPLACDASPGCP